MNSCLNTCERRLDIGFYGIHRVLHCRADIGKGSVERCTDVRQCGADVRVDALHRGTDVSLHVRHDLLNLARHFRKLLNRPLIQSVVISDT